MNTLKQVIVLTVLAAILGACTATPTVDKHYYVLSKQHTSPLLEDNATHTLNIKKIELATFLDQPSLLLQDGHVINFAEHHLWGEPLRDGIRRALTNDLANTPSWKVSAQSNASNNTNHFSLMLYIGELHPHADSRTSISLRYEITQTNDKSQITRGTFESSSELDEDGYSAAVSQLRKLLGQAARHIENDLTALSRDE